jgi:hypothetical protein
VWGEAGTAKIKSDMTPKLADCGVLCIFVGYAVGHSGNTYHMWDPSTRQVHVSCDVIWLHQMYYVSHDGGADKNPALRAEEGKTVTAQKALLKKALLKKAPKALKAVLMKALKVQMKALQLQKKALKVMQTTTQNHCQHQVCKYPWDNLFQHTPQSGHAVCLPRQLIDEIGATTMNQLTQPERHYYEHLTAWLC